MDSTVSRRVSSFLARLCHWLVNFPPLHQVSQAASLSSVPSLSQFSYSTSFYCCLLPKRTSLSMFILIDLIYYSTICHHFFYRFLHYTFIRCLSSFFLVTHSALERPMTSHQPPRNHQINLDQLGSKIKLKSHWINKRNEPSYEPHPSTPGRCLMRWQNNRSSTRSRGPRRNRERNSSITAHGDGFIYFILFYFFFFFENVPAPRRHFCKRTPEETAEEHQKAAGNSKRRQKAPR